MNVLIDTNVILDILLKREPYFQDAVRVNLLSEVGHINGYMSASAVTDIYYIAKKELKDKDLVLRLISDILKTIHVASVTESNINEALNLRWKDFEDSVQYSVGKDISASYIITRNPEDFTGGAIKTLKPNELIGFIGTN
jgi:predicted nucleic acid-binding protein